MFSTRDPHTLFPQELRQTYETLYGHGWLAASRASLCAWLVQKAKPQAAERWLDVACGDGQLAGTMEQAGARYYGVDFALTAVQIAAHPRVLVSDGLRLPFGEGVFDGATNVGSLEHFQDMAQGVQEMVRVLKPNGRAAILVPNAFSLTWNIVSVWRSGTLSDDDGQPLQRFGTRHAWESLLTANGLLVEQTLGYERTWPNGRQEWQLYRDHPAELLLALLAPFVPLNLCRCFVFLCRKAPANG